MKLKVFIKNNSPSKTTFFCLLIVHLLSTSCGLVWMSSLFIRKAVKMMKIQLEEQNDSIGRVRLTSGFFTRHPELFPKLFIFFCAAKLGGWVSTEMSSVCAPNGFSALVSTFDRFHVGPSTLVLTLLVWKGNSNVIIALLFNISYWHHTARKDGRVTRHASLQSNVPHLYKTQERYWPTDNCLSVPQYLTQSVSMLITKGSSSLTHILPTGRLTPTLFSLFTLSSFLLRLYLCLSLFPGTTHSIGDPGGLRVRLCGFPRATVSRTNSLSPTGSTSIRFWCWAGGCGSCGVRDAPGKSLTVDHPL